MGKLRNLAVAVVSAFGLQYLVTLEGYKLKAYPDGAGVWTICVGHTKGVRQGQTATRAQCDKWLEEDLRYFSHVVRTSVRQPVTQNQFDALVIFAFNIGETKFKSSTLLRKLNAGDFIGAANEFPRWNKIKDPATGKLIPSKGLSNRRRAEQQLFIKDMIA